MMRRASLLRSRRIYRMAMLPLVSAAPDRNPFFRLVRTHAATVPLSPTMTLSVARRGYREILKNTLSDTPSGYLQDPRAAPQQMVSYARLSETSEAALEALRREEEMQSREELAYQGYTSVTTDRAKSRLVEEGISNEALAEVAQALEAELVAVQNLVGQTVVKPLTENQRELRRWRRERERLEAIEKNAFLVEANSGRTSAPDENAQVEVRIDPVDGTEHIVRRDANPSQTPAPRATFVPRGSQGRTLGKTNAEGKPITADDVHVMPNADETAGWRGSGQEDAEEVEGNEDGGTREEIEVTIADVHHVHYLLGLAYQRQKQFDRMETHLYAILAENPYAVDAIQSLLEVYTGLDTTSKIGDLIEFVAKVDANTMSVPSTENTADGSSAENTTTTTTTVTPDDAEPASHSVPPAAPFLPESQSTAVTPARLTPPEIVIALLAELLTEAAALYCRDYGEGATSRFFLQALGPIARRVGPHYTSMLLEALFQSLDAQHFVARAEADDPAMKASRELIFSVVIAFLKTLVSRGLSELVRDPIRFEFFALAKLQAALRSVSDGARRQESLRVCERMLTLYRQNSSLHAARLARPASSDAAEPCATVPSPATAATAQPVKVENASVVAASTPAALDDQDDNYRLAYLLFVRDKAKDATPGVARALCLRAIDEFPDAAEPWETLALVLHREDPKGKLKDAILAAQRARELDPFNLGVILTLANLYKADNRIILYETMLDRFKLLSFMMENGASREDMEATINEITDLDTTLPRESEPDMVEEMAKPMKEFHERYDMHTTYSMPINKETRHFHPQPVTHAAQMPGMPYEVLHGAPKPPS